MQNEGLKTSLMRQKNRRKQGKALELPLPQPNHGGAEFWSPQKIQQGLDWATAKEETAELLRAEKEETKKRKAEEKLERQRIAAERQRLKGKGRQKRKGGRSKSIDHLESDLNSEEDSAQPPYTPRKPRKGKQKVIIQLDSDSEEDIDVGDTLKVVESLGPRTSRGRQLRLPQRFRNS